MSATPDTPLPHLVLTDEVVASRWFLRPAEVAALTGMGVSTVREAINRGELRARKFRGRGWIVATDDARRWIEEQSIANTPAQDRTA